MAERPRAAWVDLVLIGEEVHLRLSKHLDVVLHSHRQLPVQAETRLVTGRAVSHLEAGLHVFAPLYGAGAAARLRTEVSWFGSLVADVSDREELSGRLWSQLRHVGGEDVSSAVGAHIDEAVTLETAAPLARLTEALHSERHRRLVVLLQRWREAPRLTRKGQLPVAAADKYLIRAAGEFDHTLAGAMVTGDREDLQRARVAGRRVGYAAELSGGKRGRKAATSLKRVGRLEALLVEHAASLRTAELLQRLDPMVGVDAQHHSFALGRLYEQELRHVRVLQDRLQKERR